MLFLNIIRKEQTSLENKMKHIQTIHHGIWTTMIEQYSEKLGPYSYRVTTSSGLRDIQPMSLCNTLEEAKEIASEHMEQVREQRREN